MFAGPGRQLTKLRAIPVIENVCWKSASTRAPNSIFIEKNLEEPVVCLHGEDVVDLIGPPDPVSNLRPVLRQRLINETSLQQRLREIQDETQTWNNQFWAKHNTNFIKEREKYMNSKQADRPLTADEMSEFYKEFLDKYWETHLRYNIEWYRKNSVQLFLALQVQLERGFHKFL